MPRVLRRRLLRFRTAVTSRTVDGMWRSAFSPEAVACIYGRFNPVVRETARANWLALKGDVGTAGEILAGVVEKHPLAREPVLSLGSLISQGGWEDPAAAWEQIRPSWSRLSRPRMINQENFQFFALGVELALMCNPPCAERAIKEVYFPFFRKNELLKGGGDHPILYWHVPKTGGTSVSSALSKSWYESGTLYLPSYTTRRFLSYVVQNQDGLFPYLSTAHLSAEEIGADAVGSYRKVLVLRDPEARALSAWRQYRENPSSRLRILPQHGAIWDFYPICGLAQWAERAPCSVVNPLRWTFAAFGNEPDLAVDDLVPLENLSAGMQSFSEELGLNLDASRFMGTKNVTDKKIRSSLEEASVLRAACRPDLEVYEKLKRSSKIRRFE